MSKDSELYLIHKARESLEAYRSSLLLLAEKIEEGVAGVMGEEDKKFPF